MASDQARLFAELISQYEPRIQRAFMASVVDLQANVDWPGLIDGLMAVDIERAIFALHIDPAAWAAYSAEMSAAYAATGASTAAFIRSQYGTIGVRFAMTNPRAEDWIARNVAAQVAGFAAEQREIAREIIGAGYARGNHPHVIATDLAGRVGPTGKREGGILGLDRNRAYRYNRISDGMRTADGVRELFDDHGNLRYKVNVATAQRLQKAYDAGTAVPDAQRALSDRQFYNALIKDRADTIAETETGNAVMSARQEEWEQFAEAQGVDRSAVIKTWRHRRGASRYHRPDHLRMNGRSVLGLGEVFVFPDGARMLHAHDVNGGARHNIRCGCDTEYRLDHTAGLS